MAYVYRHIRLDKNVPFYIGIGGDDDYKRAHSKLGRNKYWNSVVAKTNFDVDILIDNIEWGDACKKETEFISIYKRTKDGGTLCNLTLGGEGQKGMIPWNFGKETPDEIRKKLSEKKKGYKPSHAWKMFTEEAKAKRALTIASRTYTAWNKGIPQSDTAKAKYLKTMEGRFRKGEANHNYGKPMLPHVKEKLKEANKNRPPWNKGKNTGIKVRHDKYKKIVLQYDLKMNFIKEFESLAEAAKSINTRKGEISNCCSGRIKYHRGFVWRYKHEKPRFQGR